MRLSRCARPPSSPATMNMYEIRNQLSSLIAWADHRLCQINTLSEIFVSWNDIVSSAEEEIAKLEREQSKGEDVS